MDDLTTLAETEQVPAGKPSPEIYRFVCGVVERLNADAMHQVLVPVKKVAIWQEAP